jgi:hypothetical protein
VNATVSATESMAASSRAVGVGRAFGVGELLAAVCERGGRATRELMLETLEHWSDVGLVERDERGRYRATAEGLRVSAGLGLCDVAAMSSDVADATPRNATATL